MTTARLSQQSAAPNVQVLALLDAAVSLQKAGELARSLEILELARAKAPSLAEVHLLLGLALMEQSEQAKAEAALRQALDIDPSESRALQALGLLLLQKGKHEEAREVLQAHFRLQPNNLITLRALSKAMQRSGQVDESLNLLDKHMQASGSVDAGIEYARQLINMRRIDKARALLETLASQYPDELAPLCELVELALYQKDAADAKARATELTNKFPESDDAWRVLARAEFASESHLQALAAIDHALYINARDPKNWMEKAQYLQRLGRNEDALEAARAGLRCGGGDTSAADSLSLPLRLFEATSLLNLKQHEIAVALLVSIHRDYPGNTSLVGGLCRLLINTGHVLDALKVLDEVGERESQASVIPPLRYEVLHRLSRAEEAEAYILPFLSDRKDTRLDALSGIAVGLYLDKEFTASRAVLEQLVRLAPTNAGLLCNLGYLLTGSDEYDASAQMLHQALAVADEQSRASLIHSNLGYLFLLTGDNSAAAENLKIAAATADDEVAIQRIACYRDGRLLPGYSANPRRFVIVKLAAMANQVILALAMADAVQAERLVHELIRQYPNCAVSYEVAGWVYLAQGERSSACEAWEKALSHANDQEERESYTQWIAEADQPLPFNSGASADNRRR